MNKNSIRYLTISRVALEIVSTLSPDDNKLFNEIMVACFHQLENGEAVEHRETGNRILDYLLNEANDELETGYKSYMQKVTARNKTSTSHQQPKIDDQSAIDQRSIGDTSAIDRRSIGDTSAIDQRYIGDTSAIDNRKEENRREENISESSSSQNIRNVESLLMREGYSQTEINSVLSKTTGKTITDMHSYLKTAMDNNRTAKQATKRILPAQDFEQRSYTDDSEEDDIQKMIRQSKSNQTHTCC